MHFRSHATKQQLVKFFKDELGEKGWQATTDNPIEISFHETLIFRNKAKELIEVDFQEVDGHWNCEARYQNAYQFAETEKQVKQEIEAAKKTQAEMDERKKNPPKIQLPKVDGSKIEDQSDARIEYTLKSGAGKSAALKMVEQLEKLGWSSQKDIDTKEVGNYTLKKDDAQLVINFVDPGFIPATITVQLVGSFVLEPAK